MRLFPLASLAILLLSLSSTASAQVETQWTVGGSFEAFRGALSPGHGSLFLQTSFAGERGTTGALTFNTETLEAGLRTPLSDMAAMRFSAKGEALAANVLADSFERLAPVSGRGLSASYVQLGTGLDLQAHRKHTLRIDARLTKWVLAASGSAADSFVVPGDPWLGRGSLGWTYWGLQPDISFGALHRRRERLRGVGLGAELSVDLRSETERWGAPEALRPNAPDGVSVVASQWLRLGADVGDRTRLQLTQRAQFATGGDDLTRERIGGLTHPFITPLAGLPWAAVRSDQFVVMQPSAAFRVSNRHELGVLLDVAATELDADKLVGLWGAGAFADLRWEHWQVDVSVGWSPQRAQAETSFFAGLFGFGWSG